MSGWFETYARTAPGLALAELIDDWQRENEFRLLSEQGRPAVQAVVPEVAPLIEALACKAERDKASQFVGWYVGQIMRSNGYEIVQSRGRVTGAPYKTGAVWKRAVREPKLVSTAKKVDARGRLQLRVSRSGSEAVADWELTTAATSAVSGRPRPVHTVHSVKKPLAQAAGEALAYARRHGFGSVFVFDPERLFPKSEWTKVETRDAAGHHAVADA